MPSYIPDLVIPAPREVRTTPAASSDEDDDHPSSGQKPTSDEEAPTVGLKPFNSKRQGLRKAKIAPEEDDVSSEEYDSSDKESSVENDEDSGSAGSEGPSRKIRPEIEDDAYSSDDAFLAGAATKQRLLITSGEEQIQTESVVSGEEQIQTESVVTKRRGRREWTTLRTFNADCEHTDVRNQLLNAARVDFTSTGTPEPPGTM
jgi:hypothetical protein